MNSYNLKSMRDLIINEFIHWFIQPENFKPSYDGIVTLKILNFWDETFFESKLFAVEIDNIEMTLENIKVAIENVKNNEEWERYNNVTSRGVPNAVLGEKNYLKFLKDYFSNSENINKLKNMLNIPVPELLHLPKPFLLLAGISGTGKTRFVREQAKASAERYKIKEGENYCLVPVRPDWHEPSDLLGYISRINGTRYITTDFFKFMMKALAAAVDSINNGKIIWKDMATVPPYWLCLDEMNLAPVEQYFADYLAILETRKWENGDFQSEPIIKSATLQLLIHREGTDTDRPYDVLIEEVLSGSNLKLELKDYFLAKGIPLPPNLIVAGTVNMDETTHGFSRKVIDRALTLDFQEFFPNDYDVFFNPKVHPVVLGFPTVSEINSPDELGNVLADPDGAKSIAFLKEVNNTLKSTPFELAYRALNELLLSIKCYAPADEEHLFAVWDDFLMQKVLPRIEGDADKLGCNGGEESEILAKLKNMIERNFNKINTSQGFMRPDLLNESLDKSSNMVKSRSLEKIAWMQKRLSANQYTSFWA